MQSKELAKRIRRHVLRMTNLSGGSHVGSCLSIADIMAVLYGGILKVDPKNPKWAGRDRFILSKGHAGAAVYAALAETGFFDVDRLDTHYQDGSSLSGHVSHHGVPGVELSTGSLGHGLGVATGMCKAFKLAHSGSRVFVLMSDGECDEGSIWEAALFAQHHQLDNLVVIIDYNKIQSLASVAETVQLEPFVSKWRAFNWGVAEIDGHDHSALLQAFGRLPFAAGRPSAILAHTTKGKGVSFMENSVLWHYRAPVGEEYERAAAEIAKESE